MGIENMGTPLSGQDPFGNRARCRSMQTDSSNRAQKCRGHAFRKAIYYFL